MLVIVILTILGFIGLYIRANPSQFGTNDVLSIYGRVVQRAEIDSQVRSYRLALALGLTDFVSDLGGLGEDENVSLNNYLLNLLLIEHQATELGIRPSDDEVLATIKSLAPLQTDGVFDPAKYTAFVQDQLAPRGLTERQMEDIVRDSIRVKKLKAIIASPVAIGEGEIRMAARIYQPVTAQVLQFDLEKYSKDLTVTPGEISAFYEKNREGLKAPENRSISYVVFELPALQQKLEGKDRANALQKLADQAVGVEKSIRDGISQGFDFATAVGKQSLQAQKADFIQRDGTKQGKDSGLPEALVNAAFRLQKIGEISDIIQDGGSFYIVTVDSVSPAHQLELAEVTQRIETHLKSQKSSKAAQEAAEKALSEIHTALNSGKSFADAVKGAGLKEEQLINIVPSDPKNNEEQQALTQATLSLKEGELGQLEPAPWGFFAVYLQKRTPLTDAEWKEYQADISKKLLTKDQDLLFTEWLHTSLGTAQIKMLPGAASTGGS